MVRSKFDLTLRPITKPPRPLNIYTLLLESIKFIILTAKAFKILILSVFYVVAIKFEELIKFIFLFSYLKEFEKIDFLRLFLQCKIQLVHIQKVFHFNLNHLNLNSVKFKIMIRN